MGDVGTTRMGGVGNWGGPETSSERFERSLGGGEATRPALQGSHWGRPGGAPAVPASRTQYPLQAPFGAPARIWTRATSPSRAVKPPGWGVRGPANRPETSVERGTRSLGSGMRRSDGLYLVAWAVG